jgi:hypothetical protein
MKVSDRIIYSGTGDQIGPGAAEKRISFLTAKDDWIKTYYIGFTTGYFSTGHVGMPESATFFGKCTPEK